MTAGRRALIVVAVLVAVAFGLPGVGAVPEAAAQDITVSSAAPDNAAQGTISLPVTIKGSGFKKGAKVKFYLGGTTNPAGITVSSTRFISSTQLTATIDVAATAVVAGFDIVVTNADGRTGKGTELFKVLEKVDPCTLPDPVPSPSAYISDAEGFPGYLDGTFGSGSGRAVGPRHMSLQGTRAIALDALGRAVVVGSFEDVCQTNSKAVWAVARYWPDGSPDPTFGTGGSGLVTTAFSSSSLAYGVAIQTDGKIIVAGGSPASRKGNAAYRPTIVRYNADGSLDLGFGNGGVFVLPGSTWGVFRAFAIQSDQKIIAVGGSDPSAVVVRLLPNGQLDASFGNGGQFAYTGTGFATAIDVTIQVVDADARILVGGQVSDTWVNRHHRFALWRLTNSGAPDTSFNSSGVAVVSFDGYADFLSSLAIDPISNSIVAAGYRDVTGTGMDALQPVLARLDVNGALEPAFGSQGKAFLSVAIEESASVGAVVIQTDGKILVGGTQRLAPALVLWRVDESGAADPAFGSSGRIVHAIAGEARMFEKALVFTDGRVLAAGFLMAAGDPVLRYAFLARFWQ